MLGHLKFIFPSSMKLSNFFYRLFQAFVEKFSRDLSLECAHLGVTVQCVLPGFVATNMSRFKSSLTVPSPTQFVRGHMNTLGLECSSPGYWVHKIQVTGELSFTVPVPLLTPFFPMFLQIGLYHLGLMFVRPIVERLAWYGLFSIRTRAVRRQQRLSKVQDNNQDLKSNRNAIEAIKS
jgi:hypothetical protein